LLPLRAFLGVTFTFAGLQKLADPGYLDPHNPTSAAHQMLLFRRNSPIGGLLELSTHAPTLVSLLIAFGELAVGLGTHAGLVGTDRRGWRHPAVLDVLPHRQLEHQATTTVPTSCSSSLGG
jgi:hypothetical protein